MLKANALIGLKLPTRFKGAMRKHSASPFFISAQWMEYPTAHFFATLGLVILSIALLFVSAFFNSINYHILPEWTFTEGDLIPVAPREISEFNGLSERQVNFLLGKPAYIRKDPPAELWQYKNDFCIVDLYFYEDIKPVAVQYTEMRLVAPPLIPLSHEDVSTSTYTLPRFAEGKCLEIIQGQRKTNISKP